MLFIGSVTKIETWLSTDATLFQSATFRAMHLAPALIIGVYIFFALRQTYGQGMLLTALKSILFIFAVIHAITNIYDFILFWIAYYLI